MDRRSNEDNTDKLQQLDSERKEKKPPSLHNPVTNSTSRTKKQTVTSGIPVAQRKQTCYDRANLSYEEDVAEISRASLSASQESISALEPYYPEGGDAVNDDTSKIEKFIVCRRLPETRHKSTNVDYISDLLKHDFIKINGASPRPDLSSARTFVLHELRSRVYRLEDELKDCRKGKQLAERMLQRHVVALEKYEGVNSSLPRLAASRTAEILSLHTGLRKVHKQLRHTQDHLRHRERRIMKLEKENKSLTEIVERGDLVNKHKLTTELEQTQAELGVATAKLEHLQSTFEKSQRHLQSRIDRETKKLIVERGKLTAAQERIQALLTKLQEKEKCIASLSLRHKRFIGLGDQKRSGMGEGTPRTENTPRAAPIQVETPRDKSLPSENLSSIPQQKIAKIGNARNVADYQSPAVASADVKNNTNEIRSLQKPESESTDTRLFSAHSLLIGRISSPRIMRPQKEVESTGSRELFPEKNNYLKQQYPQRVQTVGAQPSQMQGSGDFEALPVQASAFSMSADNVFDVSQRKKSLHLLSLESPRETKVPEYQNHFDVEHPRVSISSGGRSNMCCKTQTPRTEVLQKLEQSQSQQQKKADSNNSSQCTGQAISRAVWSGYSHYRQFPRSPNAYEYNKRLTRVANATNTQLPIVRSPQQNFQSGLPQTRFILQGSLENPFHNGSY